MLWIQKKDAMRAGRRQHRPSEQSVPHFASGTTAMARRLTPAPPQPVERGHGRGEQPDDVVHVG